MALFLLFTLSILCLLSCNTAHQKTDFLNCRFASVQNANDLSAEKNGDSVTDCHDFLQIRGNEHNALSEISLVDQLLAHELRCTDIKTSGRLTCNDQFGMFRQLSCNDQFLLIAAGKKFYKRIDTGFS